MRAPATLLLVTLAVASAAVRPETTAPVQSPREREVYVSVLADGKHVAGVQPSDLTVREDGVAREILRVRRVTDPADVALLIDNSVAMREAITDLRRGLEAFVKAIDPRNPLALVTVADRPTIAQNYTLDRGQVLEAVERIFAQPGSGTYLLDAIIEASRGIEKRGSARAAIVVVTGEGKEFSSAHHQQVVEALESSHAAMHAVILEEAGDETTDEEGVQRGIALDLGTRETGGRRTLLLTSMALPDEMTSIATELNEQYVVTYARPETLIPPAKITVEARMPGRTVRSTPVREKATR
ncbi:MAG: VWA domain-containing protein [Vicinamibacterales bacterium]